MVPRRSEWAFMKMASRREIGESYWYQVGALTFWKTMEFCTRVFNFESKVAEGSLLHRVPQLTYSALRFTKVTGREWRTPSFYYTHGLSWLVCSLQRQVWHPLPPRMSYISGTASTCSASHWLWRRVHASCCVVRLNLRREREILHPNWTLFSYFERMLHVFDLWMTHQSLEWSLDYASSRSQQQLCEFLVQYHGLYKQGGD